MKLEMQKIGKVGHAAKVIALCLPPAVMSLIGLAALSRTKGRADGSLQIIGADPRGARLQIIVRQHGASALEQSRA